MKPWEPAEGGRPRLTFSSLPDPGSLGSRAQLEVMLALKNWLYTLLSGSEQKSNQGQGEGPGILISAMSPRSFPASRSCFGLEMGHLKCVWCVLGRGAGR